MERVGRYEIVRELGRGSMSIVYEGFDGRIDRNLAIKVLKHRYARDVAARQRFLREARAAGGLAHPNIVTIFDIGQAESAPYLVMELLRGGTLEDWTDAERLTELGIDKLLDLMIQLARALAFAHQNGVIHRDIKPANIHYDPATNLVKMMDFGIAGVEIAALADETTSHIAGTLTHMAPEILDGQPADPRSDLYSLGVVLYQLISGQLPFDAQVPDELVQQIVHHQTRPLKPLRADTPKELVDLTWRLIALEPDSRPASAFQVAEELEEIRDAFDRGFVQSVRQRSKAWRWPLLIGLAVATVMTVGLNHLYRTQTRAMAEITYGYGEALTSMIAQETAEALILEDSTALQILVSDFAANEEIVHLHISDVDGTVVASTDPYLRGEHTPPPMGEVVPRQTGGLQLTRNDNGLLEFRAPIRFQARQVGQVRLGLDASGLGRTSTAMSTILIVIFSASLLVVVLGLAWMTRRQQLGLRRMSWALKRLARGQVDFRLETDRRDEFAEVYRQFNRLAIGLDEGQRRQRAGQSGEGSSAALPAGVRIDETLDLTVESGSEEKLQDDDSAADNPDRSTVTPLRRPSGHS